MQHAISQPVNQQLYVPRLCEDLWPQNMPYKCENQGKKGEMDQFYLSVLCRQNITYVPVQYSLDLNLLITVPTDQWVRARKT